MEPIHLFSLAARQRDWLRARQSAVAQNLPNANTPGFKALEVGEFEQELAGPRLASGVTHPMHMAVAAQQEYAPEAVETDATDPTHSGNSVSVEREFVKTGEIAQVFALNVGILKSFHRMMMMTAKG